MTVANLECYTADDVHHPSLKDVKKSDFRCFCCGLPLTKIFIFQWGGGDSKSVCCLHIECAEQFAMRILRETGNARLIEKGYSPAVVGIVPSLRL